MLELTVPRELNRYRKKGQPISHFRQRFRAIPNAQHAAKIEQLLNAGSSHRIDVIWTNYSLQLPRKVASLKNGLVLIRNNSNLLLIFIPSIICSNNMSSYLYDPCTFNHTLKEGGIIFWSYLIRIPNFQNFFYQYEKKRLTLYYQICYIHFFYLEHLTQTETSCHLKVLYLVGIVDF